MDKLLLAGFGLDMQGGLTALHGSVGSTALHIAAQHGHQQVCSYHVGFCSTAEVCMAVWTALFCSLLLSMNANLQESLAIWMV